MDFSQVIGRPQPYSRQRPNPGHTLPLNPVTGRLHRHDTVARGGTQVASSQVHPYMGCRCSVAWRSVAEWLKVGVKGRGPGAPFSRCHQFWGPREVCSSVGICTQVLYMVKVSRRWTLGLEGDQKAKKAELGGNTHGWSPTYQNSRRARENATSGTALRAKDRCAQADRLQGYADLEKGDPSRNGWPLQG